MIVELETAKDRWRMHELYEKQAFDVSVSANIGLTCTRILV